MNSYFDFEKSVEEIDDKINNLEKSEKKNPELIDKYEKNKIKLFEKIYTQLNAWQKVQVARHPNRPHALDYINNIFQNFIPLAGDRKFSDDEAIVGGLATIDNKSVLVIGTEKGNPNIASSSEMIFAGPKAFKALVKTRQSIALKKDK